MTFYLTDFESGGVGGVVGEERYHAKLCGMQTFYPFKFF